MTSDNLPPRRIGPLTRPALALLGFYQRHLSRHSGARCRYTPSCSQYAVVAYRRYGFFWGSLLTTWRLARCNPFGGQGWDPVSERKDGRADPPGTPAQLPPKHPRPRPQARAAR